MILSGCEIEKRLNKDIYITPFSKERLNPNSYNVRLHNELIRYTDEVLDMKKDHATEEVWFIFVGI